MLLELASVTMPIDTSHRLYLASSTGFRIIDTSTCIVNNAGSAGQDRR